MVRTNLKVDFSTFELLIPTNIYSASDLALKMNAKIDFMSDTNSEYEDVFFPDKWKTFKSTSIKSQSSIMNIDLH